MRRGQVPVTVYFRIFEILLLVMVIGIIYLQVSNIKDGGEYQKKFLARDFALLLDSVSNARGNIDYRYNPARGGLEKFVVSVQEGRVTVDEEAWPYVRNKQYRFSEVKPMSSGAAGLHFMKVGNGFDVEVLDPKVDRPFVAFAMECPVVSMEIDNMILDPGHGHNPSLNKGDFGFVGEVKDSKGGKIPESWLMGDLGASIKQHLLNRLPNIGPQDIHATRAFERVVLPLVPVSSEDAKTIEERLAVIRANSQNAIMVSLHAGKYEARQNLIKAYVHKDADARTQRLACKILNAFVEGENSRYITGTAIIPIDPDQLSPADARRVLVKDVVGVQLELGNLNIPDNPLLKDIKSSASTIVQGISAAASAAP